MTPDALIPPPPAFLAQHFIFPVFRLLTLPFVQGAAVTSGYRSPDHNEEVGGVYNSAHVAGVALDVVNPPAAVVALWKKVFPQGVSLNEGDHVHLALPRWAAWLILLVEILAILFLVVRRGS
jgi:hypothetical protein